MNHTESLKKLLWEIWGVISDFRRLRTFALNRMQFWRRVVLRFVDDRCIQRASALAYATLLAIVPMVALGFSIFTGSKAFESVTTNITQTILQYMLPTSQSVVQEYLSGIGDKAGALSIFGLIGLMFTATALLNTMEEAFNDIWRITRARSWWSKLIIFWSALTLSPILIGASLSITSYFAALPVLENVAQQGVETLGKTPFVLPWLMSSLAFATLYKALPNTRIPIRYTLFGGLISGALFELTKLGFAFYVTEVANYEKLYGVLGTLPVFLIWLFLVWVVVLVGAEVAYCTQHAETKETEHSHFDADGVRQFFGFYILMQAARALQIGKVLQLEELTRKSGVPGPVLEEWLDQMCRNGLLRTSSDEDSEHETWLPSRDMHSLTLADIHHKLNAKNMLVPDEWQQQPLGRILAGLYYRMNREQARLMEEVTLADLLDMEEQEEYGS